MSSSSYSSMKTVSRIERKNLYHQTKHSIHIWIQKCSTCAQNIKPRKTPKVPLRNISVGAPLDIIGIDLLAPLPETRHTCITLDYVSGNTSVPW